MEPSSSFSWVKPREVQLERSPELRTRVTNNVLYILRGRVGMTPSQGIDKCVWFGICWLPDLIITHSVHTANTLKYDDGASQKLGGVRTDRAWKSEFAWSVCLDLCLTDRRWSVLFLSLFERSTEQWKAFISVHGGAPHTLVPCSVSAEGGYHAEAKTACPASGMPLLCTSPLLPPLKATLPNVSVSESPWHWYMRNSERAKVRRRVLVNK